MTTWLDATTCLLCGEKVVVAGSKHLDLVAGRWWARTSRDQQLEEARVFAPHACDPATAAAHAEVLEGLLALAQEAVTLLPAAPSPEELAAQQEKARADREHLAALVAEHTLHRPCPRCGVPVGRRCENLIERRRGVAVSTASPHEERLPSWGGPGEMAIERTRLAARESMGTLLEMRGTFTTATEAEKVLARISAMLEQTTRVRRTPIDTEDR